MTEQIQAAVVEQIQAAVVEAALSGKLTVEVDCEKSSSVELTARTLEKLAKALDEVRNGPLTERALLLLIHDATSIAKGNIKKLIDAGPKLRQLFLKPEAKK